MKFEKEADRKKYVKARSKNSVEKECLLCESKFKSFRGTKYCSVTCSSNAQHSGIPKSILEKTNTELYDYIQSYCPNFDIPRKRSSKMAEIKKINFLKNMLPIQIPHPELAGEFMTISLDTFMQGEKL